MPGDSKELNSLHCFVRSDLLELFALPDNESNEGSGIGKHIDADTSSNPDDTIEEGSEEEESNEDHRRSSRTSSSMSSKKRNSNRLNEEKRLLRLFPGRVGLRCVHCAHIPRKRRSMELSIKEPTDFSKASMSTFYPKSLADLYRSVCTWQRVHFKACRHIPKSVRDQYWSLKDRDRSRGKTRYWANSARELGLIDAGGVHVRGGIHFKC